MCGHPDVHLHFAVHGARHNLHVVGAGQELDAKQVGAVLGLDADRQALRVRVVPQEHLQWGRVGCWLLRPGVQAWWCWPSAPCPRSATGACLGWSRIGTLRSSEALASRDPSSFHAKRFTQPSWPVSIASTARCANQAGVACWERCTACDPGARYDGTAPSSSSALRSAAGKARTRLLTAPRSRRASISVAGMIIGYMAMSHMIARHQACSRADGEVTGLRSPNHVHGQRMPC